MDSEDIMFDFSSYYDRIADLVPNHCKLCEVGVADGISALYLFKAVRQRNKIIDEFYMVDNMQYGNFEQMKKIYENIIANGFDNTIRVMPYDSLTASKMFNDNFFDFVFLDSSHTEETKQEIIAWYSKVKDGGILAGHDYYLYDAVRKSVDETIPTKIKRETIDTPEQYQEFEEEIFLNIENTNSGYGLYWCVKDFWKKLNL